MTRERLSNFFVLLSVFALPWQTRWIFHDLTIGSEPWEYGRLSMYAVEILILAAVLLRGRLRLPYRLEPFVRPATLAIGVLLLSATWAQNITLALGALEHAVAALALLALLVDERTDVRVAAWAFVLGLAVPSGLAWWQTLTGTSPASSWLGLAAHDAATLGASVVETGSGRLLRGYGTFPHPNVFGGYLAVGLVLCAWVSDRASGAGETVLCAIMAAALSSALVLTFSRGAWLAVLVATACLAVSFVRTRIRPSRTLVVFFALFVISSLLSLFAFSSVLSTRLDPSARLEAKSIEERASGYREWIDVARERPFFGVGPGNYTVALATVFPGRPAYAYQPVHNAWLLFFAETGLIGLMALTQAVRAAVRFVRSVKPTPNAGFAIAALLSLFVVSLLDHYPWSLWPGLVLVAATLGFALRWSCRDGSN